MFFNAIGICLSDYWWNFNYLATSEIQTAYSAHSTEWAVTCRSRLRLCPVSFTKFFIICHILYNASDSPKRKSQLEEIKFLHSDFTRKVIIREQRIFQFAL